MLFNSYIFVFLFFPLCLLGYFGLNKLKLYKLSQAFVLCMSLWFYGYFNSSYLLIIIGSILVNFCFYKIFQRNLNIKIKRVLTITGVAVNVLILFYYKYYDFFISNINEIFEQDFLLKNLLLPLGISFFTFQQISFVIDAYKGEVSECTLLEYASFVTYFPQLIAGPIVTHDELIPQFHDLEKKKFNWDNFSKGIYIFALGLGKKVLLADTFGNAVNWGWSNVLLLDTTNAIIVILSYTIQIYFDFSGYCDMAIGIGKMMNIDIPLNFNSPYKAITIREFWKRWHMTLTRFLTKYIYIPLGGRSGIAITCRNIMVVYFISGLWHGANWTFVLWGIMHGLFSVITRVFENVFKKIHPIINWCITFAFVNIAWVFFRADSITNALRVIKRVVVPNFGSLNPDMARCFELPELKYVFSLFTFTETISPYLSIIVFFVIAFWFLLKSNNAYEKMLEFKGTLSNAITTAVLLVLSVLSFSGISTFLYFNF